MLSWVKIGGTTTAGHTQTYVYIYIWNRKCEAEEAGHDGSLWGVEVARSGYQNWWRVGSGARSSELRADWVGLALALTLTLILSSSIDVAFPVLVGVLETICVFSTLSSIIGDIVFERCVASGLDAGVVGVDATCS